MLFDIILPLLLARLALAQTPTGFSPNVTAHLDVTFGTKAVDPGISLTKAETASKPTIGTSDIALSGTYIFFMIDLDVPGQYAGLPAGSRTTNLHALLTGYKLPPTTASPPYTLLSTDTGPKAYIGPGPPAETPAHPHTYVELLFEQPAGFAVPASQTSAVSNGISFNITQFVIDAKLAAPVRGNWFTVTG